MRNEPGPPAGRPAGTAWQRSASVQRCAETPGEMRKMREGRERSLILMGNIVDVHASVGVSRRVIKRLGLTGNTAGGGVIQGKPRRTHPHCVDPRTRTQKEKDLCCDDVLFFHLVWQKGQILMVCVCARACVFFCVCIHSVEISIEKVTPLHSPRCYTLHILFMWVLVCQWDTSGTLVRRGWIGIKRGNAVWLKEEGIVQRYCQKPAFFRVFYKMPLAQRDKMRQRS